MTDRGTASRFRDALRRHDRWLIRAWLAGLALLVLVLSVPATRGVVLGAAQRLIDAREDRWTRRVEHGEALLAAGLPEQAAEYLAVLDAEFPARHVKHRRDTERVRVLRTLAESWTALGEKREALEALRWLVAFDPREFRSHHELAMTALTFDEVDEARLAFVEALRIHPGHLPSLRAYAGTYFEAGDWSKVVEIFEQYLSAFTMHELELRGAGDSATVFVVPVDGRFHDVVLQAARPAGWRGELALGTRGLLAEVAGVRLDAPLEVGRLPADGVVLAPEGEAPWVADGTGDPAVGRGRDPAFRIEAAAPAGVERIALRLRVPKPVDPELWAMVEKSYRNLLDHEGLAAARARCHVLPSVEAERFIVLPE